MNTTNHKSWTDRLEDEPNTAFGDLLLNPTDGSASQFTVLRSPEDGIVCRILSIQGAAAKAGDVLATVDSLKIEIHVASPVNGIVAAIACQEGDMVCRGKLLLLLRHRICVSGVHRKA